MVADVFREFVLVNSATKAVWKTKPQFLALERNGSRIKQFRKLELRDVDGTLIEWVTQETSDNVPMGGSLPLIIFFFLNFNFTLMHFVSAKLYENLTPPPMPPHVLMNFRGFPPGCGDSVADF